MRKITLLLLTFILSLGYVNAQSALPNVSEDDKGPWYYVRGLGSGDDRENRYWTVEQYENEDKSDSRLRVFGRHAMATSIEDVDRQLFRFEDNGDGSYSIISKFATEANPEVNGNKNSAYLSWYTWAEKNQSVTCFEDIPQTDWWIRENTTENQYTDEGFTAPSGYKEIPQYYTIRPTEHGDTRYAFLHQGNRGFQWCVVLETSTWGYGANSSFYFIEYHDPGLIVTPEAEIGKFIDFGYVTFEEEENLKADSIQVLGTLSLVDDITVTCGDSENFYVTTRSLSWKTELENEGGGVLSSRNGEKLDVWFTPEAIGEYETTVTIKSKRENDNGEVEDIVKTVTLKGVAKPAIPVKTSPTIAPSSADVWYTIYFDKRSAFYLTDSGLDKPVDTYPSMSEDTDSQLWKFVPVDGAVDSFNIVNKLGHQLVYNTDDEETGVDDNGDPIFTPINLFYSTATPENTFSFKLRSDGGYGIVWNEYVGTDPENPIPGYVAKKESAPGLSIETSLTNAGVSVQLFEKGSGEWKQSDVPVFSTAANPVWYYIQFQRVAANSSYGNHAVKTVDNTITDGEGNETIQKAYTQAEIVAEDSAYYFRFEGDWEKFKVIDAGGTELDTIANQEVLRQEAGLGAFFNFARFKTTENWQLHCIESPTKENTLNDFTGAMNMKVGGWTLDDGGCELILTKVSEYQPVGIENIPVQEIDDPVVATVYYTIQGIQLGKKPTTSGLYIEKSIYASKKVSAKTIYIVE
ncbi:MAG: hypothetical protein LBH12_06975 [Dysgonamonadaceae bacterium]|jgi:hypothetical protein|nr:hypothetical protein [Dysgonamonadaceae bacterium]